MKKGKMAKKTDAKLMSQQEIEKAYEKMCRTYAKKGVDFDTRDFFLTPTSVLYLKTIGDCYEGSRINFTKDVPVKHSEFKLEDYPAEVQEILKRQYGWDDPDEDYFPNFIGTPSGDTLLEAIEEMTKMSILLDYGWTLFPDDEAYESEHEYFFGNGDEDDDWEDDEEEDDDEEDDEEEDDDEEDDDDDDDDDDEEDDDDDNKKSTLPPVSSILG